jgi:hypothetical protein
MFSFKSMTKLEDLTVSTTPGKYKLFTGVNDTGDKFFAGVVDTAEQLAYHRCR